MSECVYEEGKGDDGYRCTDDELVSAKKAPAEDEKGHIAEKDHHADLPACDVVDKLGNPAHTAAGKIGGNEEEAQSHGLDECAEDNEKGVAEEREFFHTCRKSGITLPLSFEFFTSQCLNHADHSRVVEITHAHFEHGTEELGVCRSSRQRNTVFAGGVEDDI